MENNSIDSSIDRYSDGEMTPEEIRAFNKQLASDPESAKLFAAEQLIQRGALTERLAADAAPISSPSRSLITYLQSATRARRLYYGLAAGSFAVLLGFLIFSTSEQHAPNVAPMPSHQSLRLTDAPKVRAVASEAVPSATPISKPKQIIPQQLAKRPHSISVPWKDRDFDEPKGKPRVFAPDSVPFRLRTR
jgi:anti-sigma factor RsiW